MGSGLLTASDLTWTIDDKDKGWNEARSIQAYFHNSEMQRQWAWQILGKYKLKGNENILDFGSGDGKVTAEISHLVKNGSITGVDLSHQAIKFAQTKFPNSSYPNLFFQEMISNDFSEMNQSEVYDLITSFSVFHIVPNPEETFSNLYKALKPGGTFLLAAPIGGGPFFIPAAEKTFTDFSMPIPWKQKGTGPSKKLIKEEDYREKLELAGFTITHLDNITRPEPYANKEEFIHWMIGTMSANWAIPFEKSNEFFTKFVEYYIELYPEVIDTEGTIFFPGLHIEIIAKK